MADSDITIVGFVVTGGVNQAVLQWAIDDPNVEGLPYLRYRTAEVWYSPDGVATPYVKIAEAAAGIHVDPDHLLTAGAVAFYKVRAVNRAGGFGEFSAVQFATEISGDELFTAPNGFWKHPTGLIFEWGQATVAGGQGNANCTFFNNRSNTVFLHFSAQVSRDDVAAGRTEVWSTTIANVTFFGSSWSTNVQVRRGGHNGALTASSSNTLEAAPDGTLIYFFAIGAQFS